MENFLIALLFVSKLLFDRFDYSVWIIDILKLGIVAISLSACFFESFWLQQSALANPLYHHIYDVYLYFFVGKYAYFLYLFFI